MLHEHEQYAARGRLSVCRRMCVCVCEGVQAGCLSAGLKRCTRPLAHSCASFHSLPRYTQRGGRRPFGISTLITGFDKDGTPHLFETSPSGTYSEWVANAIGGKGKTVKEFLEQKHEDGDENKRDEAASVRLAVEALLEVVDSGAKNIAVAVMKEGQDMREVDQETIAKLVEVITEEKEKEKEGKKNDD